jgi:hypothetical protein
MSINFVNYFSTNYFLFFGGSLRARPTQERGYTPDVPKFYAGVFELFNKIIQSNDLLNASLIALHSFYRKGGGDDTAD